MSGTQNGDYGTKRSEKSQQTSRSIARFANLLGVNAPIEVAHVEGAGKEFKVLTDEIHHLAARSADAASKTSALTKSSASLSKNDVLLSREIDQQLERTAESLEAAKS